jgi:archaellum component FlaC
MDIETLLWVGGLAIEVLVVVAVVLAVLLRRSQKARQHLPADEAKMQAVAGPVAVAAATAAVAEPVPAEPVVAIEIASSDWIDAEEGAAASSVASAEVADNAQLKESTDRLRQQLDVTNESLRRLEGDLGQDPTGAGAAHLATLKGNLQDMHSEIDSLQKGSAKLREDMSVMRDKLRHSEADMQTLQKEKERLAAEYTALSMEYERVYANSTK